MHRQGSPEAVAGRQGMLRPETEYVLQRFGIPSPALITDVRPKVKDVMTAPAVSVSPRSSLLEVGQALERHDVRVVTVVDGEGRLLGVTGQADFARAFIGGLEDRDSLPLDRASLLHTLGGTLLVDPADCRLRDHVMVGAMEIDSMLKRIEPGILLVLGDRQDAQQAAIEFGVGGLVVTGDTPVSPDIIELARARGVLLISVPHHTYRTLRLIQLSVPVEHVMLREVATCGPDDLVEDAREQLQSGSTRSLIVVDEGGRVRGVISRTNLLRTVRQGVVLVDHNERGQAVTGIEEADVIAVIDHHRVADFWTRTPPYMRLEPVGATSTIVAKLFAEAQQSIPEPIAGVLLSGILADTLLFRGPTTTPEDQRIARSLAATAQVDVEELGKAILDRASDVSDRTAEQLLLADFKEFRVDGACFGIGTIETTNAASILSREGEMLRAMTEARARGYDTVLFAIVDILREQTTLLVEGHEEAVESAFAAQRAGEHKLEVPSILSRKKNIVPLLGTIGERIKRS
jgi:manganese-dependent inorganic pyrophosphatase